MNREAIEAWSRAENVLAVRLDAMGDLLMTTPALQALKQGRSGRRLTLLTSPSGAAVARLLPMVDEIIPYDAPWMKATAPRRDSRPDFAMIERLRHERFDAAAIFTVYSQNPLPSAMLAYLANIPRRLAHCHENPYQLLNDWLPDPEPDRLNRHEVRRQLDLVAHVGRHVEDERLRLAIPDAARSKVAQWLAERGLGGDRPWLVLHAGATAPSRRYPPEQYAEVARRLTREDGFTILFTGGEVERPLIESIRAAVPGPTISLAGELSLAELAALIERAPLLVSNNTGPVHVAAAVGTPVVVLYALTNPQHTPWLTPSRVLFHEVPCRNCYKSVCPEGHQDCLRLVPPEAVVKAARDLLAEVGEHGRIEPTRSISRVLNATR